MAMIEARLVEVLLADAAIAALVETRIDPVAPIQGAGWPCLTYRRLGSRGEYTFAGRAGWRTADIEIAAWAKEYPQARDLAEAVRDLFDAFDDAENISAIRNITVLDGADDYEPTLEVFSAAMILQVQYDDEWVEVET